MRSAQSDGYLQAHQGDGYLQARSAEGTVTPFRPFLVIFHSSTDKKLR